MKKSIKKFLYKIHYISFIFFHIFFFLRNILNLFLEKRKLKIYKLKIDSIIKNKEIVLNIKYGGLGDWLSFTSLPRLLKEKYDIDFYLTSESLNKIRDKDIFKMLFEQNPYFKGIKDSKDFFDFHIFAQEKKLFHFFTDRNSPSITEILEHQFGLTDIGNGLPEVFYIPNLLDKYKKVILVDKNYISGKKIGWLYNDKSFDKEIKKYLKYGYSLEYVDPSKQGLFFYTDMIFSCQHFITVLSGGAVLATCFKKPFSVILPYNVFGETVDQFVFKNSSGTYIK